MKNLFIFLFVMIPEAFTYLFNVIVWRFSKKECIGCKVYFKGRQYIVIGETYHHFYIEDTGTSFLKDDYYISDNYLINKKQVAGKITYKRFKS